MKRALEAHMTTTQALYDLYLEEFLLQHPHLRSPCTSAVQHLDKSCERQAHQDMLNDEEAVLATMESNGIFEAMAHFDKIKEVNPLFKFVRCYMKMVLTIFQSNT